MRKPTCDAASISSLWSLWRTFCMSSCRRMSTRAICSFRLPLEPLSEPQRSPSPPLPTCRPLLPSLKCCILCPILRDQNKLFFGSVVKNPPANARDAVRSLGQEDPLEQETATHSSILAWEIPWTEGPGGLQSMGL